MIMVKAAEFFGFLIIISTFRQSSGSGGGGGEALITEQGDGNRSRTATTKSLRNCNLFQGSWVYDESYPLYDPKLCPFLRDGFNCLKNQRPDQFYLKYRWQPNQCDPIPRFDAEDILRKFTGKKIMFVGDSLSLNQWQSFTCMLYAAMPHLKYELVQEQPIYTFSFPEYRLSIMMHWHQFLVSIEKEKMGRVLILDSITSGDAWRDIDMLVFNSWHWWWFKPPLQPWDYARFGDKFYKDIDRHEAFKLALESWARWIDENIDPSKTKVFFQGISTAHYNGWIWNNPRAKNCKGETRPYNKVTRAHPYNLENRRGIEIVKTVLRGMKNRTYFIDISLLSQLRQDAHPSMYVNTDHNGGDCTHWCLPGVPDTWNELLYVATLLQT